MHEFDVEMIWASRYDYGRGNSLLLHAHDYYQLIYIIDGEVVFTCGDERRVLRTGDCAFITPSVAHGFTSRSDAAIKTLDMKFRTRSCRVDAWLKSIQVWHAQVSKEIVLLLEQIKQEGLRREAFFREMACVYLLNILYVLHRHSYGMKVSYPIQTSEADVAPLPGEAVTVAEQTRAYITNHYAEELRVADIAKHIGFSNNYVGHMFKQRYGCTISRYIQEVRIGKAKQFMAYTEITLKEMALQIGFKNIHHFNRVFKQLEGISPGQWKQREVQGIRKDIIF
ncbi:AraC family transcriptional regulator [Paenibacillus sp. YYML68]|uniref:AraC family transcriptional regulator n=1 Tax=Paenibacillus sp. YYML68 TaxID=2909250 RepID=UPI0024919AEB|nr:AraC family transcriptional regulator [Paenibacillus sp. YYML68]